MSAVSYVQAIAARADTTAATSVDRIASVSSCEVTTSTTLVAEAYLGDDGWDRTKATRKSFSMSLSGRHAKEDPAQSVMREAQANGSTFYITVIEDEEGGTGGIGTRYPVVVESYQETRESAELVAFTASLKGDGPPVVV